MSIRSLVLNKRIREKKDALEVLRAACADFATREQQLEADIDTASTDEERSALDEAINQFEADQDENRTQTAALEAEIADLENQLAEAERAQSSASVAKTTDPVSQTEGSDNRSNNNEYLRRELYMPILSHRERTRESLTHAEVRSFYQNLSEMIQTRATGAGNSLTQTEILIPEIVMTRIEDRMGDYATVAREVETIAVGGTSRIILDGADPEAIWVEMSGAISEVESSFKKVELDGWKLAGYMVIPNDIIDDALINLAEYVEKKLAKAIAKSRDKAILNGSGSNGKQLVGIIPSLAESNKPASIGFNLGDILSNIAFVDDGEETYGEIICVMKRSTFYRHFVKKLITVDSAGRYVVPNLTTPNIGVRVVMSQYMPENKILFGDFKRYMLAQRSGVKLAASTDVKFVEDQTVIKGLQRMDGKPVHVDGNDKTKDWVLVTIDADAVNRNDLNSAIARAYGLTEAEYTSASWTALKTALTDAVTVANNTSAAQAAINSAADALNAAIGGLVAA